MTDNAPASSQAAAERMASDFGFGSRGGTSTLVSVSVMPEAGGAAANEKSVRLLETPRDRG